MSRHSQTRKPRRSVVVRPAAATSATRAAVRRILVLSAVSLLAPTTAHAVTVTEFPVPVPKPGDVLSGITSGPGGLWFTGGAGGARITTDGQIGPSFLAPVKTDELTDITRGPDGNVWFTQSTAGDVGRIVPAATPGGSPTLTVFNIAFPAPANALRGIAPGPDGNLWVTGGRFVKRVTPAGALTGTFDLPAGREPDQIVAGPDGNLWFTENGGTIVGRITPAGVITEFPTAITANTTSDITAGPDGNLWFTAGGGGNGRIGRITTAGVITNFDAGLASTVPGIAAGGDGNLWFTQGRGWIGRITPAGVVTEYKVGDGSGDPYRIAAGPDGSLWFTERVGRRVGRITTEPDPPPPTPPPAAPPVAAPPPPPPFVAPKPAVKPKPSFTASASAKRLRTRVRIRVRGELVAPGGIPDAKACTGDVIVSFKRGDKVVIARSLTIDKRCEFGFTAFAKKPKVKRASKLALRIVFLGNAALAPVTKVGSVTVKS